MAYIFQATLYCDPCGEKLLAEVDCPEKVYDCRACNQRFNRSELSLPGTIDDTCWIECPNCGLENVALDEYSYDSDNYPKGCGTLSASDSPDHCASDSECIGDAVNLEDWGLPENAEMVGAETPIIGELVGDELTEYGVGHLKEMLEETPRTPYQEALHNFWRAAFADYL